MSREISTDNMKQFVEDYQKIPQATAIQTAVMNNGIFASSQSVETAIDDEPIFSIDLETGSVSNQKQSGRCWMFAALNTMRHSIQAKYKIKDFELSQNYTNFWDKFEKSNYFYENVIKTANEPLESRKVSFLMKTPQQDGGQWDMLCAIIQKYGIVPKNVMPETFNSSASADLNGTLNFKLRKDASKLRQLVTDHASDADIQSAKDQMLNQVYRILVYALGQPPVKFDFEYRDTDKNYHRDADLTPQSFYDKYIGWNLSDYVSIINSPTDDKPYDHLYTVEMLGNVVGGRQVRHLNVDLDTFKALAVKQLQAGETIWFGSDVGKESDRKAGILDLNVYHNSELFSTDLKMTKAQQLDYGESLMTHAMVITGVDLVDGKPTKWKVENSWGDKVGDKGYFVMNDNWFDQYVYQLVINKAYLTDELNLVETKEADDPTVLAPWDPMGALA